MKFFSVTVLLAFLFIQVLAWTKEDHEIFDLVSAIKTAEGKGTTFYSWLDVPSSASAAEINRAYKKKSVLLHPDKNRGVKDAHERFARLGVVATILRNAESRERYDFFYKNGVPKWRGTGYYYSRYRPGLGSVFIFLTVISTGLQYLVQRMNYKSDLARIERTIRDAKLAAWGAKMVLQEGKKKVKVNLGGKGYIDEDGNWVAGKMIDMVVEGNDVFIVDGDGTLIRLDSEAASPPSIRNTWAITMIGNMYLKLRGKKEAEAEVEIEVEKEATSEKKGPNATRGKRRKGSHKVAT